MFSKIISFISSIRRFWNEMWSEVFKKSIWPKPRELAQYTLFVCIAVVMLTCVVYLFDISLNNLIQFLTKLVGA